VPVYTFPFLFLFFNNIKEEVAVYKQKSSPEKMRNEKRKQPQNQTSRSNMKTK